MLSRKNNQELENTYERATCNCHHGFGGFCGTCMYCVQPRDLDKLDDFTVAYCTLSRKEEK